MIEAIEVERTTKAKVLSRVCKFSNGELGLYIDGLIGKILSGKVMGEELLNIKLEAQYAAEILKRRQR